MTDLNQNLKYGQPSPAWTKIVLIQTLSLEHLLEALQLKHQVLILNQIQLDAVLLKIRLNLHQAHLLIEISLELPFLPGQRIVLLRPWLNLLYHPGLLQTDHQTAEASGPAGRVLDVVGLRHWPTPWRRQQVLDQSRL
ncbi:MAG: hypothetical protein CMJ25_28075 [Phycisphaerae bacterium]|nr:hypothetical protein [Phycisphaerae bacterium]